MTSGLTEINEKAVPVPNPVSRAYWEGCRRHQLLLQKCEDCGHIQWYPRSICLQCMSTKLGWIKASGKGIVYSWSTVWRPPTRAFASKVPYTFALVDLEEGVRITSSIVGCSEQELHLGMPVEVFFEDVSKEISLPKFRKLASQTSASK